MKHFELIQGGFDVSQAALELDLQSDLWNERKDRTIVPNSPHRETTDIWCRYCAPEEMSDPFDFHRPFVSTWYPAWKRLPALWPIYHKVAMVVAAEECGGVLITRIPAGRMVYAHNDRGSWHAEHYTTKVWMPIKANAGCVNYCVDESVVMRPGDAWSYSNLEMHAVENGGDTERVCLIMCFRCEP